jgi:hypothetical protein
VRGFVLFFYRRFPEHPWHPARREENDPPTAEIEAWFSRHQNEWQAAVDEYAAGNVP